MQILCIVALFDMKGYDQVIQTIILSTKL